MIQAAIVTTTLRAGETCKDFLQAWYHTEGLGTQNRMFTILHAADPSEVIALSLTETSLEEVDDLLAMDPVERQEHPLDDVIEPHVARTFGILVAEDGFSDPGTPEYPPARVAGQPTDFDKAARNLREGAKLLAVLGYPRTPAQTT